LYNAILLKLFIVFSCVKVEIFGSLRYRIMLAANRDTLTISLLGSWDHYCVNHRGHFHCESGALGIGHTVHEQGGVVEDGDGISCEAQVEKALQHSLEEHIFRMVAIMSK
jgi:hypothetical protein